MQLHACASTSFVCKVSVCDSLAWVHIAGLLSWSIYSGNIITISSFVLSKGNGGYISKSVLHAKLNLCSFICSLLLYATRLSENGSDEVVIDNNFGTKLMLGNYAKKRHRTYSFLGDMVEEENKLLQCFQCGCLACIFWWIQKVLRAHHLIPLSNVSHLCARNLYINVCVCVCLYYC